VVLAVRKTFVFTKSRVEGTNIVLSPCAAQLPDGSIDHAGVVSEPPSVMIISELDDGGGCELLNVSMQDARKLAQALLQAADEIDRWATTRGTRKSQRSARHPCGGGPTTFARA